MITKTKQTGIYLVSVLFIALNAFFIYKEIFWFSLLPLVLSLVLLSLLALDKLFLLIVFCTPIAINIENLTNGYSLSIPTEPLMFGAMLVFILRTLYEGDYDARILKHPITICILLNLAWMIITTVTSELPFVSFKYVLARTWFLITSYFIAIPIFKNYRNIKVFLWLYIISFTGVILYTIIHHSTYGFDEETGHWVMFPFYNDHTSYGALLAMYIPAIVAFCLNSNYTFDKRLISFILLVIFGIAIVLSYTRAAWVSLVVALGLLIVLLLRIKLKWVVTVFITAVAVFFMMKDQVILNLEKNKQDSSSNLSEHVQSISNIRSDASNLERLNRWSSALKMFEERPFFGWGPGTYSFLYAPFQDSENITIISTNAGNRGNAHSEYLGPLAESGVLGSLSFIAIVLCTLYYGIKLYLETIRKEVKLLVAAALLGLTTYFTHGLLNNYLDTDKAAIPFWGFMAILVALKIYHSSNETGGKNLPDVAA